MRTPIRTQAPIKVVLLLRIDISSGRQQMTGIFRFIREGHPWNVRLLRPSDFTRSAFREAVRDGIQGIITSENNLRQAEGLVARSDMPVAIMDPAVSFPKGCRPRTAYINIDDFMIGKAAAAHLLSCGSFQSFAFLPDRLDSPWAQRREEAFAEVIRPTAEHYSVFPSKKFKTEAEDRRSLLRWLQSLPKPAAIMAACDYRAVTVVEICNEARIRMPSTVSLISVDNDELYGDNLSPSLSSVEPDFEKEGYIAASMLDKMIRTGCAGPTKPLLSPVSRVVVRESTASTPPAAHLIREAHRFIRHNALSGIKVADVVAHIRCSRRLLDLRFREFSKLSIRAAIEQQKLFEVKRLLASSNDSFTKIAIRCGFSSLKNLERVFHKRTGTSMREWKDKTRTKTTTINFG